MTIKIKTKIFVRLARIACAPTFTMSPTRIVFITGDRSMPKNSRKPQRRHTSRRSPSTNLQELLRTPSALDHGLDASEIAEIEENILADERRINTERRTSLSNATAAERKACPLVSGFLDYFPDACAAVAHVSKIGNDQHNYGQPLHWARNKSADEADCIVRHLIDRGTFDIDPKYPDVKVRHTAKAAWRCLALLQKEIEEAEGLPISRASRANSK